MNPEEYIAGIFTLEELSVPLSVLCSFLCRAVFRVLPVVLCFCLFPEVAKMLLTSSEKEKSELDVEGGQKQGQNMAVEISKSGHL